MKTTKVFLILNEQTMRIEVNEFGKARMFETYRTADEWATGELNMFDIVKSHFTHDMLHHESNQ